MKKVFHIINPETREPLTFHGKPRVFNTAQTARDFIDNFLSSSRYKIVPFTEVDESIDWVSREQSRFNSGEYTKLLYDVACRAPFNHFPHVAIRNPKAVAFTKNHEDGLRDKQTIRAIKAYLDEFIPDETEDWREYHARKHIELFSTSDLKWAITPDEIVHVYTNFDTYTSGVADSCMRYPLKYFGGSVHPVAVYGNSDLKVAYITNEDGKTTARALVYEDKKIYTRVYGSDDTAARLHNLLKTKGYEKSAYFGEGRQSFAGAKLPAIKNKEGRGYVFPYLDEVQKVRFVSDDHFVIDTRSETYGCPTSGYIIPAAIRYVNCEKCDARVDHMLTNSVQVSADRDHRRYQQYCDECLKEHSYLCYSGGPTSSDIPRLEHQGRTYSVPFLRRSWMLCEATNTVIEAGRSARVYLDANTASYQMWGPDHLRNHAFLDPETGRYYDQALADPASLRFDPDYGRHYGRLMQIAA